MKKERKDKEMRRFEHERAKTTVVSSRDYLSIDKDDVDDVDVDVDVDQMLIIP